MSGISGIYNTDGRPVDDKALDRMIEALAHRGPDGRGTWFEGSSGLGHRMFHETPESMHERQPCKDIDRQLVLTADARIDNREDLLRQLELTSEDPLLVPDSRLILLAYAQWGEDCVDHLLGDFAFALWDGRLRSLFCARDFVGIKPFFYYYCNNRFRFSSELKGILCLDDVPQKLNEEMIASYLVNDIEDREITFYQDLFRLPPAHVMRVDRQGLHKRCYWKPDTEYELHLKSDAEYAEAFRNEFTEAVRCRLRSAFPVGSELSGGMDSSSVTCMARDLLSHEGQGRKLKSFSAIFDHLPQVNERRYQDSVIAGGNIEPCRVPMEGIGPLESYLKVQHRMDYPFQGFSFYVQEGLHPKMQDQKVRILLGGFGGDDVVCHGHSYLRELASQLHLVKCYRESRDLAKFYGVPVSRVLWRLGLRPNTPAFLLSMWQLARYRRLPKKDPLLDSFPLAPDLFKHTKVLERAHERNVEAGKARSLREEHGMAFTSGLLASVFEIIDQSYYDRSLVARHPFYDRRLVEFCLSLPHNQKLCGGWTRMILRRAMEGILPVENQWRPDKSNISPHFFHELRGRERPLLLRMIERISSPLAKYVDIKKLQALSTDFLSGNQQNDLYLSIWPAISLGAFLLEHLHLVNREEAPLGT